ncbi:MAG TPA: LytTR family DNA-binding domain-containing protein [Ramlibacter sp.]|uniref:LytR/AlgR family response regulator transcription factor n=1 Tax=Ramlibacter sp. TaxID=1917967 RepID=UPI002BA3BA76|nr:LytTR family DNA-binding domain-containing protein [Ramlibacter sp.]HVZ44969.1 LytTR family DNA-binding domain-containing protein [Ramlibacter sp.]
MSGGSGVSGGSANAAPLRALIADDERLLREQLKSRLASVWPELEVVAEARDGAEAVDRADALRPDVVFLDIRMPGLSGIEAAREILALPRWQGEIVFVTAYDEYAIAAFEQGALDYLLKPVEPQRLAQTAQRLKSRLGASRAPERMPPAEQEAALDAVLERLMKLQRGLETGSGARAQPLRWIQATAGNTTKMIDVNDVLFFRSDEKYTRVQTKEAEAFIRTPIRELVPQLDPQQFWQIHRSAIVNLGAVSAITRDDSGRQRVHISGHPEVLEVSRSFAHLFRGA